MELVGRTGWMQAMEQAMAAPGARLALVGPAGVGKTALARAWSEYSALQVVWVREAERLDAPESADVVVLDGVGEAFAWEELDAWAGSARVLLTTRGPAGPVPQRRVPPLETEAGVALFEARTPHPGLAGVPELVAGLEGLPQAILWAAERSAMQSPRQVLENLSDYLATPLEDPGVPPQVDAVGASWASLKPELQRRLAVLSTFEGDFALPDAAGLLGLSLEQAHRSIEVLQQRSLVGTRVLDDRIFLHLWAPVRAFCRLDLKAQVWQDKHAWLVAFGETQERVGDPSAARAELGRMWLDVCAAEAALSAADLAQILVYWTPYLRVSVPLPAALARLDQVLSRPGVPPGLGGALAITASAYARRLDQLDVALRWAERAIRLAAGGTPEQRAAALTARGDVHMWAGRLLDSAEDLEQALALSDPESPSLPKVWRKLAGVQHMAGVPQAHETARRAAALAEERGDVPEQVVALCHAALYGGSAHGDAERLMERALSLARAESGGQNMWVALVWANRVLYHARFGDPACGQQAYASLMQMDEGLRGLVMNAAVHASAIICHLLDLEQDDGAMLSLATTLRRDGGAQRLMVQVDLVRAWRALRSDQPKEALRLLDRARYHATREEIHVLLQCFQALAWAQHGSLAKAWAALPVVEGPERDWAEAGLAGVDATVPARPLPEEPPGVEHRYRLLAELVTRMTAGQALWRVAEDGAWIAKGETQVALRDRPTQRRVLRALVEALERRPGDALSADALIEAGWPGEKMSHRSGRQRLWATIRILRAHGLGEALETVEQGYRLDGAMVVVTPAGN